MPSVAIYIVFEDRLHEAVIAKLLKFAPVALTVHQRVHAQGATRIRQRIEGYNRAARYRPCLVLADADTPACPRTEVESWLPQGRHPNCLFRLAVPEVEGWLLADRQGLARYLGVAEKRIDEHPDALADAKQHLLSVARSSRYRAMREDILPLQGQSAHVGPRYNVAMVRFVRDRWDVDNACRRSESLRRAVQRMREFRPTV